MARKRKLIKPKSKGVSGTELRIKSLTALLSDGKPRSEMELSCYNRQLNDLKNGHERGLIWDEDEAQRAVKFMNLLRHWKGAAYAGKPFTLEPWQEEGVVAPLFGWYKGSLRKDGGLRRFRKVGIELPRKNGKSSLAAGIGLFCLIADSEPGAEVYSAATMRDQAAIVFDYAKNMVGPELKRLVKTYKHAIIFSENNGTFRPLAADAHSLDGLNASCVIVDELHAHKERGMWDILLTSIAARTQPIIMWISTAGHNRQSIWYEERGYCERLLLDKEDDSFLTDDSYLVYFTRIDTADEENWLDPIVHEKANPNYGISVSPEYLTGEFKRAEESVSYENKVRRLHLNQMTEQDVRWMPMHLWDQNTSFNKVPTWKWKTEHARVVKELEGRPCYAALDLASSRDICAWAKIFPFDDHKNLDKTTSAPRRTFKIILQYFCPEEAATQDEDINRRLYKEWANQGIIETTPGKVIDYSIVQDRMFEDLAKYDILQTALDPWNIQAFFQTIITYGWPEDRIVEFRQSPQRYNEPMSHFLETLREFRFDHMSDPVLRWMAGNVTIKEDSKGYIMPSKSKSQGKIDGITATFMAFALAMFGEEPAEVGTFYEANELEMA